MSIPVLVIDPEYGARERAATATAIFGARRVICPAEKSLLGTSGTDPERELRRGPDALADIDLYLCTGQVENGKRRRNALELVAHALGAGWPHGEGWRWALVILGQLFESNPPAADDACFAGVILDHVARRCPGLRVAFLPKGRDDDPRINDDLLDLGANSVAGVLETDTVADSFRNLLRLHGLIPDIGGNLVGRSVAWMSALRAARVHAGRRAGLLMGPHGSGKEGVARYIHDWTAWSGAPGPYHKFPLSNGAADTQLVAVFGIEAGVATDVKVARPGVFEQADQGTLVLDEIHNCSPEAQERLLSVLEQEADGRYYVRRLGATKPRPVDVRTVAVTNLNPHEISARLAEGRFREDLFSRLGGTEPVPLPPLLDRLDDIPGLFTHFVRLAEAEKNAATHDIRADVFDALREAVSGDSTGLLTVRWLREQAQLAVARYPTLHKLSAAQLGFRSSLGPLASRTEPKARTPGSHGVQTPPSALRISPQDLITLLEESTFEGLPREALRGLLSRAEIALAKFGARAYEYAQSFQDRYERTGPLRLLCGDDSLVGTKVSDVLLRWARLWEKSGVPLPPVIAEDLAKLSSSRNSRRGAEAHHEIRRADSSVAMERQEGPRSGVSLVEGYPPRTERGLLVAVADSIPPPSLGSQ